ncbi:MAG: extracellular solute-binding protein [Oscillospiraceae bacterium]|nr:extracellular solute-binding protein [Oscillospiraceae bacterium]
MNAKRIISGLLCAAMIISVTGCDEAPANTGTGASGGSVTELTSITTTTNTLDDDINNPVDISDFVEEKTLANPNLVYFSHYDARVAGDIKPGVKLFEETYGGKIDYIEVAWAEAQDRLATLIASGDSPDLVDKGDNTFPSLMAKNMYEDLTDYIDLTKPQWDGMHELIENYSWNGKHFYYPFTVNALPNCLIYNKTLFEDAGIDDPKELYDNNNWTWDTFKNCMQQFMDNVDGAVGGVYGLLGTNIIITTGVPFIGAEGGKITNNIHTAEVERATLYLEELRREKLAVRGDGMWSNETAPLAKSKNVAFLGVGQWKITDFCKVKTGDEFGFVPYPRDPAADKYYYGSSNFGYMVPKGSENIEGAAAFIDIMRQCNTDPELKKVIQESIMNDKQYSVEQYDFLTSFEQIQNFDMVVDIYGGFSSEFTTLVDDIMINLAFEQSENQQSWAQLRGSYEAMIEAEISEFQALQS